MSEIPDVGSVISLQMIDVQNALELKCSISGGNYKATQYSTSLNMRCVKKIEQE